MKKKIIIDNGAGIIKAGFSGENNPRCTIPNCVAKAKNGGALIVGEEISKNTFEKSHFVFQRPHDRGYLINWEVEYEIWKNLFGKSNLNINDISDFSILLTEPPFAPTMLSEISNEIIFEEYGFNECYRCPAPSLSAFYEQNIGTTVERNRVGNFTKKAMVIVDSGFSFTHVFCFYNGKAIQPATVRLNVGGKLLTNYLKEVLSYRQWNVMDEFQLVNQAKEEACFVSLDFDKDMIQTRNKMKKSFLREFILPDYKDIMRGFIIDPSKAEADYNTLSNNKIDAFQSLRLETERFSVPELLFSPSNVGIMQGGVHECIADAIKKCPEYLQPFFGSNIKMVGGCSNLPGYKERLQHELRKLLPIEYGISVNIANDPELHSWIGGSYFANDDTYDEHCVTKTKYYEEGHRICESKFINW